MNSALRGCAMRVRSSASAARSVALDRAGRLRDQTDFFDDALASEMVGDLHEGDRRGFQHRDRAFRSGALGGEHERRSEPEHAFRRQLPHIADIGLLGGRALRIDARGIDRHHALLETERVENLRHGSAHRHDPPGILDRHRAAGGVAHRDVVAGCRCCRKHTQARNSDDTRAVTK
jgi:hypothetical protein